MIEDKERFYKSRVEKYEVNRENLIQGNINCIPTPFPRFIKEFPGIEQSKYYLVTANEKVGKCFGIGTKVRMFDGTVKEVQDIVVGDEVMGPDNTLRKVKETHRGFDTMYRINQLGKGVDFTVNSNHILHLRVTSYDNKTRKNCCKIINISITDLEERINLYRHPQFNVTDKYEQIEVDNKGNRTYKPFKITEIGPGDYYGFEVDDDHLFLLADGTIVHNSQITDHIFMIHPLHYAFENRDKLRVKILYFTLEMSKAMKFDQLTCNWLYRKTRGRYRLDTKALNSLIDPLPQEVLDLLNSDEYAEFFDFIEDNVLFYDNIAHPTGIYYECKKFAESRGTLLHKEIMWKDPDTGIELPKSVIDKFVKDDPNEYWIVITDHVSLLTTESGLDLRLTINKFSANYSMRLRNLYGFSMVAVQQQSAESQSNESFKLDRLAPHPGNLADNKTTKNDIDVMIGIYAPWRFKQKAYLGYDITLFKDNIRFLEVILNRSGSVGGICPLYFDGAVNHFKELPLPSDDNLRVYEDMALEAQRGNQ